MLGLSGLVCVGLLAGVVSPAWADQRDDGAPAVELGSLTLGDGLEGMLGESDGSVRFEVPVGGLSLSWDSRLAGVNRYGFGERWGIASASVDTDGGVRVRPASGGVFEADASQPSGLSGYSGHDVVFRAAEPGAQLEARPDGAVDAQPYAFELHELEGRRTLFNANGDPIATIGTSGDRTDWVWAEGEQSVLAEIVSVDGVSTALDWTDTEVTFRPGSNVTSPAPGSGAGGVWRVALRDGALVSVTDPLDQVTHVSYDDAGLVTSIGAASGAVTSVAWGTGDDAVPRVSTLRVHDEDGAELSRREWSAGEGGATSSGWPAMSAGGLSRSGFSTTVSDGATRVESTFDAWRLLTHKKVVATTSAGQSTVQEQHFDFPDRAGVADPTRVPAHWSKPVGVTLTYRDATGAERTGSESYEFDELGRMVRRASADGTVTERTYDDIVPVPGLPVIGLPTSETVTAADGLVVITEFGLTDDRRATESVRTSAGRPGDAIEVTGLTEYAVEGGRVTEQRVYPGGDEGAAPLVTTWHESVDVAAGTKTVTETVAAGTPAATTNASVSSLVHGNALETTDVVGITGIATYDQAGRPVMVDDGAGRVTYSSYRSLANDGVNAVTVTGPDGVSVTEERDELGRLVRAYDDIGANGERSPGHQRVYESHTYPMPGIEESTDAWGATTRTELDVHERPVKVTLPTGLVQIIEHDDVGMSATAWTSPTGSRADAEQIVTKRFDGAGRTVEVNGTRADGVAVPEISTVYDGFGRRIGVLDGVTESTTEYDAAGNPVRESLTAADAVTDGTEPATSEALVAERRFDGFGASLEKTLSAGDDSRSGGWRELDVLGRTVVEIDQAGQTVRVEYTPDGLVSRTTSDAGYETVHTYDPATRALIATRTSAPTAATVTTAYEVDRSTGLPTAVWDPTAPERTRIVYDHDAFGNVTLVQYPGGQPGAEGEQIRHE